MLLSSSPARASSLMLLLLTLPTLTFAIVSPIWLYFQQRHAGLNLNQLLYSTTLSWSHTITFFFNSVQYTLLCSIEEICYNQTDVWKFVDRFKKKKKVVGQALLHASNCSVLAVLVLMNLTLHCKQRWCLLCCRAGV